MEISYIYIVNFLSFYTIYLANICTSSALDYLVPQKDHSKKVLRRFLGKYFCNISKRKYQYNFEGARILTSV